MTAVHIGAATAPSCQDRVQDLLSTQAALTEALVATQDQLLALKALAQVNVRGVASAETVGLLLDEALVRTGASQLLLLEDGQVTTTRGDLDDLDRQREVVLAAVAAAPEALLQSAASDSAMIAVLDPDGGTGRHIAFFRPRGQRFSTTDLPLIEAVTSALGVMMAFHELHQRELEQAAVEREHQLASALAQSVVAADPPGSSSVDVFAASTPASLTGGDFYVFGQTEGSLWFTVGDVAGKGLPAAMLMTRAVSASRIAFLAHRDRSVAEVYARIEDELFEHLDDAGLFVTLVVGVVEEATGSVSLVNAGHSPVLRVHEGRAVRVASSVPPLGVVRGRTPRTVSLSLAEEDCLLIGTDGLVDQCDNGGAAYGYDRFEELCGASWAGSASRTGERVLRALEAYADGTPAADDATLVVLSGRPT